MSVISIKWTKALVAITRILRTCGSREFCAFIGFAGFLGFLLSLYMKGLLLSAWNTSPYSKSITTSGDKTP